MAYTRFNNDARSRVLQVLALYKAYPELSIFTLRHIGVYLKVLKCHFFLTFGYRVIMTKETKIRILCSATLFEYSNKMR